MSVMPGTIRIVSDGTGNGTQVLDGKGDPIRGVTCVHVHPIMPNEPVIATVVFSFVQVDVAAVPMAETWPEPITH